MSNLANTQPTQLVNSIGEMQQMATALASSGYFKDAKDASQAFVKILAGHELNIPPFAAMSGIHIIQGKPELGANILASLVKSSNKYDYRVTKLDATACVLAFFERRDGAWEEVGTSSFDINDAKNAGTQNIGKYPRNMLFARAISNGVKWFCPEITSGMACYTDGEISGGGEPQSDGDRLMRDLGRYDGDCAERRDYGGYSGEIDDTESTKEKFKAAILSLRAANTDEELIAAHEAAQPHAVTDQATATLGKELSAAIARIRDSINPPSDNPLESVKPKLSTVASDDF